MPPLSLFLMAAIGLLVRRKRPRLGLGLVIGAAALLWVLCLPVVSASLMRGLQQGEPVDVAATRAGVGAIVILAGDSNPEAPEYGGSTVGRLTLERVRYGARLARETGIDVLVSGGVVQRGEPPLAEMMRDVLQHEYGVQARWVEDRSGNTEGNARQSASLLRRDGVARVYLVTHAWHMPRARAAFEREGIEVVPAPTGFRAWPRLQPAAFLPSARGLQESAWALHEWLGRAWYALTG